MTVAQAQPTMVVARWLTSTPIRSRREVNRTRDTTAVRKVSTVVRITLPPVVV